MLQIDQTTHGAWLYSQSDSSATYKSGIEGCLSEKQSKWLWNFESSFSIANIQLRDAHEVGMLHMLFSSGQSSGWSRAALAAQCSGAPLDDER